jgi:hypothetical protein
MRVIWVVSFVVAHHKIVAGTSRSLNDGIGAYGLRLDFFVIHPVWLTDVDLLWKKSNVGWCQVAGADLLWEENTTDRWMISRTNKANIHMYLHLEIFLIYLLCVLNIYYQNKIFNYYVF